MYAIDNGRIPRPIEIDDKVEQLPFSVLEYINVLNYYSSNGHIPVDFSNFKFFPSNKMNIDFILNNYSRNVAFFVNDGENELDGLTNNTIDTKMHLLSGSEQSALDKVILGRGK